MSDSAICWFHGQLFSISFHCYISIPSPSLTIVNTNAEYELKRLSGGTMVVNSIIWIVTRDRALTIRTISTTSRLPPFSLQFGFNPDNILLSPDSRRCLNKPPTHIQRRFLLPSIGHLFLESSPRYFGFISPNMPRNGSDYWQVFKDFRQFNSILVALIVNSA